MSLQEIRARIRFLRGGKFQQRDQWLGCGGRPGGGTQCGFDREKLEIQSREGGCQRETGISSAFDCAAPDTRRAVHTDARAGAEDQPDRD